MSVSLGHQQSTGREDINHKVMDKLNELERKVDFIPKGMHSNSPEPSLPNDRLSSLEGHFVKLVEVIAENSKPQNVQPVNNPIVPPAEKSLDSPDKERLKNIEAQMKELIQITANSEKVIIKGKETKSKEKLIKEHKKAIKKLEKTVLL